MLAWLIKSDHLEIMLIVIVKNDYKGGVSTFLDPKKQLEMIKIVMTSGLAEDDSMDGGC